MVALQIRDVSDEVRDALAERARSRGQSLQAYLLAVVEREAAFAGNLALLGSLDDDGSNSATLPDVLVALDEARTGRGSR